MAKKNDGTLTKESPCPTCGGTLLPAKVSRSVGSGKEKQKISVDALKCASCGYTHTDPA